jgi:hypothetical protein
MIYLHETYEFHTATPKTLEEFISLASEQLIPLYESRNGRLMAAWICNAKTLFLVNQITEFEDTEKYLALHNSENDCQEVSEFERQLFSLVRERNRELYQSASPAFSDAFQTAVKESRESPLSVYTIASLEVVLEKWPGFLTRQEGGLAVGIPIIAFMKSITGKHNMVIDIWKGDLQAAGYQPQEFYDKIGFNEEWWKWIREIAPREKMQRVFTLPYSPLK